MSDLREVRHLIASEPTVKIYFSRHPYLNFTFQTNILLKKIWIFFWLLIPFVFSEHFSNCRWLWSHLWNLSVFYIAISDSRKFTYLMLGCCLVISYLHRVSQISDEKRTNKTSRQCDDTKIPKFFVSLGVRKRRTTNLHHFFQGRLKW